MIQVGDKFFEDNVEFIVLKINGDSILADSKEEMAEFPDKYVMELMYSQQQQRADEAEKRADAAESKWEKLKYFVQSRQVFGNMVGLSHVEYYMNTLERGEE